jgi:hypothetical protein
MMETGSLIALVVAVSTALGTLLHQLHIRKCDCFCINSDCRKIKSEVPTPNESPRISLAPIHLKKDLDKDNVTEV